MSDPIRPWNVHDEYGVEYDFCEAIRTARQYAVGELGSVPLEAGITVEDIAEIDSYAISYHGIDWTPGDQQTGTELDLLVLAKLNELGPFLYAVIIAGNDYTGWGCQDWSDIRITATRADAIKWGMGDEDRRKLGLTLGVAE